MQLNFLPLPPAGAAVAKTRGATDDPPIVARAGHPLHIVWRTLYPGDLPHKRLRKKVNRPVVLSSYVKTTDDGDAAPRVVNAVYEDLADRDDQTPSARRAGAAVVHYTQAVRRDTLVEIALVSKGGGGKDIDRLHAALQGAGEMPLLLFASGWINAGAGVVKIASDVVRALSKDQELFSAPFTIPVRADAAAIEAPRRLLAATDPRGLLEGKEIKEVPGTAGGYPVLTERGGGVYRGDEPYVIFEVDQRARPELEAFEAQVAAGALLADWMPREGVDVVEALRGIGENILAKSHKS